MLGKGWKKPPFVKRAWLRWLLGLGFVAYLIAAFMTIEVNWSRVYEGLDRGWAVSSWPLQAPISFRGGAISGTGFLKAS